MSSPTLPAREPSPEPTLVPVAAPLPPVLPAESWAGDLIRLLARYGAESLSLRWPRPSPSMSLFWRIRSRYASRREPPSDEQQLDRTGDRRFRDRDGGGD